MKAEWAINKMGQNISYIQYFILLGFVNVHVFSY